MLFGIKDDQDKREHVMQRSTSSCEGWYMVSWEKPFLESDHTRQDE